MQIIRNSTKKWKQEYIYIFRTLLKDKFKDTSKFLKIYVFIIFKIITFINKINFIDIED